MPKDQNYVITKQRLPESLAHCIAIDSIEKLPDLACYCVIIDTSDTALDVACISQLRQKPHYQFVPIFYLGNESNTYNELLDGKYDEASFAMAEAIQAKMEVIQESQAHKDFSHDFELLLRVVPVTLV